MEKNKIRLPVVSGQFYPSSADELRAQILGFVDKNAKKKEVLACMFPHAGYVYSGRVAVETACRIRPRQNVILLGPNHTGYGAAYSLMSDGIWQTPLGGVEIESALAKKMLKQCSYLEDDRLAHGYEHSLEVELPILQYFFNALRIVPIALLSDDIQALKRIGDDIAKVILDAKIKDSTLLLASSDMTHYEPKADAQSKDKEALEAIIALDEDKLMEIVRRKNITMCGYAPVAVMLKAAKALGASKAELVKYQTSGDITGDYSSVVGYAGVIVY